MLTSFCCRNTVDPLKIYEQVFKKWNKMISCALSPRSWGPFFPLKSCTLSHTACTLCISWKWQEISLILKSYKIEWPLLIQKPNVRHCFVAILPLAGWPHKNPTAYLLMVCLTCWFPVKNLMSFWLQEFSHLLPSKIIHFWGRWGMEEVHNRWDVYRPHVQCRYTSWLFPTLFLQPSFSLL